MSTPPKSVEISIGENKYNVAFPNTGDFLSIQSMKGRLIGSNSLINAFDSYAYMMAEMIATYTVLLPELKKVMNVESIMQLSMVESKELLDSYNEVYKPFFDEWMNLITKPKEKSATTL